VNKTTKYLVVAVIVLCLAYPGCAWLIGLQVQSSLQQREQQQLDMYPGAIVLLSRQYHRSVYGASEDLVYGIGASTLRALAPLPAAANLSGMRVSVHRTIHHGPLPQFRAFAPATFSTQIQLPPDLSAKLRTLLGGAPEVRMDSRLGWLGGVSTLISVANYDTHLPDGTQLGWRGVSATTYVSAGAGSNAMRGGVDDLELKSAKFQVQMSGLQLRTDLKRAFDTVFTGPFSMSVASVKWQAAAAASASELKGLSISGTSSAEGDYYRSAVQFGTDALQTPAFSVTHAAYDVSFEHLYGPTLAAIMKKARAVSVPVAGAGGSSAPAPALALGSLQKGFTDLLVHEPVVNISDIGFSMPEGSLKFSATASVPGIKREELEGQPMQAALMQHLNLVADLRIDTALLTRLMAGNARKDALTGQLDALEKQGYIKRDGTALTAHLNFGGGKLTVNGQPFVPGGAH